MTKAITHYGESAVQMALDLVERPCMSKDVGAPGSLARRANDLGRRLVIAEDDPQARTTKQDEAEHKAAMLDLTRSRFRAETFEALIARLRGEVETTGLLKRNALGVNLWSVLRNRLPVGHAALYSARRRRGASAPSAQGSGEHPLEARRAVPRGNRRRRM